MALALVVVLGSFVEAPDRPPQQVVHQRKLVQLEGTFESPRVTPDTVDVKRLEFIRWRNPFPGTVTIQFADPNAPVRPLKQIIGQGGRGEIQVRPDAREGVYKYNVTIVVGTESRVLDPYIDIPPPPPTPED
jgi:hypothetical protein